MNNQASINTHRHYTENGINCISYILDFYKIKNNPLKINEISYNFLQIDVHSNVDLFTIKKILALFGINSKAFKFTFNELQNFECPMLIHNMNQKFQVVIKIDDKIELFDTEVGIINITKTEFEAEWTGATLLMEKEKDFIENKKIIEILNKETYITSIKTRLQCKSLTFINKGSFGEIYEKKDQNNQKTCIKLIPPYLKNDIRYEVFKNEITILNTLKNGNNNIVKALNIDKENNYFEMEWSEKGKLSSLPLPFSVEKSLKYFLQLMNSVKYIHSLNIVHLDIKLSNLLIFSNDNIKLSDFGSASFFSNAPVKKKKRYGTFQYMPPNTKPQPSFDLFSSGVCLFKMLYNDYPELGNDNNIVIKNELKTDLLFDSEKNRQDLTEKVIRILKLCLEESQFSNSVSAKEIYEECNVLTETLY